jgi:hypothetical protein
MEHSRRATFSPLIVHAAAAAIRHRTNKTRVHRARRGRHTACFGLADVDAQLADLLS